MWVVTGSRHGIVELTFAGPITSKEVKRMTNAWGEVRGRYLSLVEPGSFIAALKPAG